MFGHFFGNYLVKNGVLTEEQLDDRILRDFKEFKNKQFKIICMLYIIFK